MLHATYRCKRTTSVSSTRSSCCSLMGSSTSWSFGTLTLSCQGDMELPNHGISPFNCHTGWGTPVPSALHHCLQEKEPLPDWLWVPRMTWAGMRRRRPCWTQQPVILKVCVCVCACARTYVRMCVCSLHAYVERHVCMYYLHKLWILCVFWGCIFKWTQRFLWYNIAIKFTGIDTCQRCIGYKYSNIVPVKVVPLIDYSDCMCDNILIICAYVQFSCACAWLHISRPADEAEDPSYQFEQEPTGLLVGIEIQNLVKVICNFHNSQQNCRWIAVLLLLLPLTLSLPPPMSILPAPPI